MSIQPQSWLSRAVLKWHAKYGRHDLPWQHPRSAYRVWVSEIMLQQTQVSTVIPYFERFLKRFPTLKALANAKVDDVLELWSGLGYYARGRNLHKAAQHLVTEHKGLFPQTVEALSALPGIGRSTAGAIVTQSFDLRAPILDGNVKRVLCRLHCVEGWAGEKSVENQLWILADYYTPSKDLANYTQAMMDLGATLCTRSNPQCDRCPLQSRCEAYQQNAQAQFPFKKPKKSLPTKNVMMLLLHNSQNEILLEKRPSSGIWGGLWSLPEFGSNVQARAFIHEHFNIDRVRLTKLPPFTHTFSHYRLEISPCSLKLPPDQPTPLPHCDWVPMARSLRRGLPAPIKKLLKSCYDDVLVQ